MKSRVERFVAGLTAALMVPLVACRHAQPQIPTATGMTHAAAPSASGTQTQIAATRQSVEPVNAAGWIALGNKYFDSQQRQKAVEAYSKALQLEPNNPDVLTDQGVMYRELGAFDKAIANFEKASTINPRHLPSLLNLGVLYAQDLKDPDKAIKIWTHLIQIAPATVQAARAGAYIEQLKLMPKPN